MYKEHPSIDSSLPDSTRIWRYLDTTKFLDLLQNKTLHFTQLTQMNDPYEGALTTLNVHIAKEDLKRHLIEEQAINEITAIPGVTRKCMFVNCWHINEYESAAMWHQYSGSGGIAIQTTLGSLKKAMNGTVDVHIGLIKYIDYEKDVFPLTNLFYSVFHKRKSFEHEQEIRAVVSNFRAMVAGEEASIPKGLKISVDIDQLIESIYISPASPRWLRDLIDDLVHKKFNLKKKVIQSTLLDSPLY
jgi:hypothetical protein